MRDMPRKRVTGSLSSAKNTKIDFSRQRKKGFTLPVFLAGCGRENHQHEQTLQASSPTLPKAYLKYEIITLLKSGPTLTFTKTYTYSMKSTVFHGGIDRRN